jgi:DNA invertase Pin-like site-specific DNA recombinase
MMYLAHQAGVVAREAAEQLKEQLKEQLSQAQGEGKLFAKALEGAKDKGALSEALEKQGSALKEELVKAVQDKSVDAANKVVAQMKDLSTEIQLRENTNSAVLVAKDLWTHYFG